MIEQKRYLRQSIIKYLDDAIDRAENGNLIDHKFTRFCPHKDNPNIGVSDTDQELLDKQKLP
jgi:hypothetical protein